VVSGVGAAWCLPPGRGAAVRVKPDLERGGGRGCPAPHPVSRGLRRPCGPDGGGRPKGRP